LAIKIFGVWQITPKNNKLPRINQSILMNSRSKKILLCSALVISGIHLLFAQRIIEVTYTEDTKGSYNFVSFCNYIVEIKFSSLDNAICDKTLPYRVEVSPGSNKLFKISKQVPGNPIQFKYQVSKVKGCMHPIPNADFTYLLPIAPGKEAQAYELQQTNQPQTGNDVPTEAMNVYVIRLRMKPGDTIYAARRGRISEVDANSGLNDAGKSAGGEENYIEINHSDCSFARYAIIKQHAALVRPGQMIEAGQPIGLVGGDQFGRGSDVKFSVYYNLEQNEGNATKMFWNYIPVIFWTRYNGKGKLKHGGTYISEHPKAIIEQELPKPATKKPKQKARTK
jgi:hypothetical protein